MILFGVVRRYVEHLETEVEVLRAQLWKDYRSPSQQKKREHDPPPASLVEVCAMFEQEGPRLLADAHRAHAKGESYEAIEQRIRGHIARHSNGGGA